MAKLKSFGTMGPFFLLFALLYAAFGAASPFLPALMEARSIPAEQIGIIFGAATAIRLISAPVAGRIADRTHALRATLAACTITTALAALGYLSASGFWALLVVSLLHALALAPTTNLADALAVVASKREGFEYGWARGAGSAAFIVGSIAAGFAISAVRDLDRYRAASNDDACRRVLGRFVEYGNSDKITGTALLEMYDGDDRLVLDHGASGAPVLDCQGRVVAVVSNLFTQTMQFLRISTAWGQANIASVPIQVLKDVALSK